MAPRSCAPAQRGETAPEIAPVAALLTRRTFLGASACAVATLLTGCGSSEAGVQARQIAEVPCPYNWDNLIWDGGRPVYYENDQICSRWGVDVSEHQHTVDWEAVAGAGATAALPRASWTWTSSSWPTPSAPRQRAFP